MQKRSTVNDLPAVQDGAVLPLKRLKRARLLYNIMKATFIQMTVAMIFSGVSIAFDNHAQEVLKREVSLELKDIPLIQVLKEIEKAANVKFVYSPARIHLDEKVSLEVSRERLGVLLSQLLGPRSIKFKVQEGDNYIILVESERAGSSTAPANVSVDPPIPLSTISGRVTDDKGIPIPGVNIIVKGTTNGTTTDSDGRYSLEVEQEAATLIFSFIGYTTAEVAVNGRSVIDITLVEDVLKLNEIVVVGYSTQEKKDITGSVSVVDTQALRSIPSGSASQALQGLASGVTVISSGAPGGRNDIFIRGVTSFGNTQPLIIVDGVQVQNGLNDININDIESMQVLKDAGAAAIYGVRGSNGVIVVNCERAGAATTGNP